MYKVNKSGMWLDRQDNKVKRMCTDKAISNARKNTQEGKVKSRQLECVRQENLRLSRDKIHAHDISAREKKEMWFGVAFENGGLWSTRGEIEDNTRQLSVTSAKSVLKTQINIRTKVLKCTAEHILFTSATVDELKEHLAKLITAEIHSDYMKLYDIIRDPMTLTGMKIKHRWADESKCSHTYNGQILEFMKETNEFKVVYGNESPCYMKPGEIITDITTGDLSLLL